MNELTGVEGRDAEWAELSVAQRYHSSIGGAGTTGERVGRPGVLAPLRSRLFVTDFALLLLAMGVGLLISSRQSAWAISPLLAIYGTPLAIAFVWLGMLALRGSYDQRIIGLGTEEIRRVVSATLYTFAIVAGISYLARADISRAYAFVSLPLGLVLLIAGRFAWRGWLYRRRSRHQFMNRTVVIGDGAAVDELAVRLKQKSYAGYLVVARHPGPTSEQGANPGSWVAAVRRTVDETDSQAVAISPSQSLTSEAIRELAWNLESQAVDLLIAPAMMEMTGPRLSVRPAAGIPLLHLDQAALSRPQRFAKRTLDVLGSTILVVLLSPVLLACAAWVRTTSRGPILFKQVRIGEGGQPFTMLKFRTMVDGADAQREALRAKHALDDPMFKLAADPRITRAGRVLRRWSLDELPQLFNVLGGSMSLVGPRPHPLDDVNRYEIEAYRRLALKPGMTGLWQVEGRSDLDWAEALELDLYYVETWSLSGDVVLLMRTIRAVAQGRGAT